MKIRKVGFCKSVKTHVKTQPTSSMIRKMGFCKSVKTHVKTQGTSSMIRKVCFFNAKTLPLCFGLHNKHQFPKTMQNIDVLIKLQKTIIFISLFRLVKWAPELNGVRILQSPVLAKMSHV